MYFRRKCLILQAKFSFMIDSIRIRNYKSIVDLTLGLGRFNVIIGTNGCGKSNILEAITMASAASQNKLDTEFLLNRNVRVTDPDFMMNAFDDVELDENNSFIQIDIEDDMHDHIVSAIIGYFKKGKVWLNAGDITDKSQHQVMIDSLEDFLAKQPKLSKKELEERRKSIETLSELYSEDISRQIEELRHNPNKIVLRAKDWQKILDSPYYAKPSYASFFNYRPVEKIMRDMLDTPIYPLGIRGEGLFQYLKEIGGNVSETDLFEKINEGLKMLDWFEGVSIPENQLSKEYKLAISDKFLKETLHRFDQRSTNEGFLYLLFFLTLFNSKDTPSFFAVDNIETSFNPGLCQSLTRYLTGVTKENDKQVILTTHNPYVLDGLDLSDDEQRLFVCRRDIDGHTRIERIKYREDRKMSLSQLWMSGLIGALPDNF